MTKHRSLKSARLAVPPNLALPADATYCRPLHREANFAVYYGLHRPEMSHEHTHDVVSLVLVVNGAKHAYNWQDGSGERQRHLYEEPSLAFFPAEMLHHLEVIEEAALVKIYFARSFVREVIGSASVDMIHSPLSKLAARDQSILRLATAWMPLCAGQPPPNKGYVGSLTNVLGTHLLRTLFAARAQASPRGGLSKFFRKRLEAYIEQHLADDYQPDAIARAAGFSTNHLHVVFRATYKEKLREYFRRRQVAVAEAMLLTTDESILKIALTVGFQKSGTMSTWFRKLLHCSPSDVRRQRHQA